MNETIGLIIGLILTLLIYSYLIGDNPLYRIAVHILVGVSAGYATIVVVQRVILPVINEARENPQVSAINWLIPLIFLILLLFRRFPKLAWLSDLTLALLVGVGTAVALVGALTGTLIPQLVNFATDNPVQGIIIALLTICTLLAFQFTPLFRRNQDNETWEQPRVQRLITRIGQTILMITFGAFFATVLSTTLVLLADRINFYLTEFLS